MRLMFYVSILVALFLTRFVAAADDSSSKPRSTPLTRPEMKQYLEDMKQRRPRIPLPELADDEKASVAERGRDRDGIGGGYEGRLRSLYMPAGEGRGDFGFGAGGSAARPGGSGRTGDTTGRASRESDPNMTLDYKFKTQLFWIASRTNNCQY